MLRFVEDPCVLRCGDLYRRFDLRTPFERGRSGRIILHGLRRWHDHRGQLRHGGQRVSRHYYDVFRLLESPVGVTAEGDRALAVDCARHARMFFNTRDFDLSDAPAGTWSLAPDSADAR